MSGETVQWQRRVLTVGALVAPACAQARAFFNFQTPVTPIAHDVLFIHDLFLVIIAILFVIGVGALLYSTVAHSRRRNKTPATFTRPIGKKQWIWAAVPFVVLLLIDYVVLGIPALYSILALANTSDAAMTIKVTGHQWYWQYQYPSYNIGFASHISTPQSQIDGKTPKNPHFLLQVDHPLVLPTHEKIRIVIASADVIHAFWVPSFGIKQDAVPGYLRQTWVKIQKPGTYRGQCAELCGPGHSFMPIVVDAVSPARFQTWAKAQQARESAARATAAVTYTKAQLIAKGRHIFETICASCHQPNGMGLPGMFPPIAAGHPFKARASMLAALKARGFYRNGDIVEGPVANHIGIVVHGIAGTPMPSFASQLSAADIAAVITFERNDFGNHTGDVIEPSQVAALEAGRARAD